MHTEIDLTVPEFLRRTTTEAKAMNSYEAKQEARKARYEELAEKNQVKADREFHKGDLREEVSGIPFGQPILVGHHSEGRHRNAIKRANNAMRRGIDAQSKAGHYAAKADSVGKGGISSDDPEAVVKLREKLAKLEARQERMKAMNKAWRALAKKPDAAATSKLLDALDDSARMIVERFKPEYSWQKGPAEGYELSNNNANMTRVKERIADLERAADREPAADIEGNGYRLIENVEENRIQLFFPGKPSADIRSNLKSNGFRWSRYNGCWQRHLNNAGRYAATHVVETLIKEA